MKRILTAIAIASTLISCLGVGGGDNSQSQNQTRVESESKTSASTCCDANSVSNSEGLVEVLYMHGKQRCVTCVAIGTEATEVVKELGCDKVVMRTIDFSTPEGEKVADKYEVASSSLIVVKGDKVENVTAMSFQYAKNNPELFKQNLKAAIQKLSK